LSKGYTKVEIAQVEVEEEVEEKKGKKEIKSKLHP
jgi:hypothetical protein